MSSAKHPLRNFLESTSVKGVSKIVKTKSAVLRFLWTIAVLFGGAVAIFFLYGIFALYLSFSVTMNVVEVRDSSLKFPSLTLCNLNPFANTQVDDREIKDHIGEEVIPVHLTAPKLTEEAMILHRLMAPWAMFENLVLRNFQENDKASDFVVTCSWDSDQLSDEHECVASSTTDIFKSRYGYCHTFAPPQNASYIHTFSAILFIDNTHVVVPPLYKLTHEQPFAAGAYLAVHKEGTYPDFSQGTVLQAGENTHVYLSTTRRRYLPTPYSSCSPESSLEGTTGYKYSRDACLELCFQRIIRNQCGCTDGGTHSFPTLLHNVGNYETCGYIHPNKTTHDNAATILQRLRCVHQILLQSDLCDDECPTMCVEDRFSLSGDRTPWPHEGYQLGFWKYYINLSSFGHHFEVYGDIYRDYLNDSAGNYQRLTELDTMARNFLQVIPIYNIPHLLTWFSPLKLYFISSKYPSTPVLQRHSRYPLKMKR